MLAIFLSSFQLCFRTGLRCYIEVKKLDYLCNCRSEISNVCNVVEGHCHQVMEIVYHHANGCFDKLTSGNQSINPSREAISILSGKYKRFTFVHPVLSVPCGLSFEKHSVCFYQYAPSYDE